MESDLGSVQVQYHEIYLGPPSNIGDKHEVTCIKVVEITPPKLDRVLRRTDIEDLLRDSVVCIFHGALWVSNPFKVLSCLPEHFLSITLTFFGLNTLLIVVYPTFDCTRLVIVRVLAT